MKQTLKFIFIIFIILLNNSKAKSAWGEGELQLSDKVAQYFIQFIKGEVKKSPADFYVTLDGTDATYWFCPAGTGGCREGVPTEYIKICERQTGKKCKRFAFRRYVKWKNDINPAKGKASKFNSKWSDQEILAKLTELGFYKNDFDSKEETSVNISSEIKELKKLLDDGILSKEEFEKAKKKILN